MEVAPGQERLYGVLLVECDEVDLRNELARLSIDNGGNKEMLLMRLRYAVGHGRVLSDVRLDPVDEGGDINVDIPILSVEGVAVLKVPELRMALIRRAIAFHPRLNKADLVALLNQFESPRREAAVDGGGAEAAEVHRLEAAAEIQRLQDFEAAAAVARNLEVINEEIARVRQEAEEHQMKLQTLAVWSSPIPRLQG